MSSPPDPMDDRYLQQRLDDLLAECEADPAAVGRLYLAPSYRRLLDSCEAVRRAAEALARRLDEGTRPADSDDLDPR